MPNPTIVFFTRFGLGDGPVEVGIVGGMTDILEAISRAGKVVSV